jgi:predicted kinase
MRAQMDVIILRGVPGSGKSTWEAEFTLPHRSVSTDTYFLTESGEYHFDGSKLGKHHKLAFRKFQQHVNERCKTILLDNTNIKTKHYRRYVTYAIQHGYMVYQKCFHGQYENVHGVPSYTIERMLNTFEIDKALPHWNAPGL